MQHKSGVLSFCLLVAGCATAFAETRVSLFSEVVQGPSHMPASQQPAGEVPPLEPRQGHSAVDAELFGQLCSGCHGPRGEGGSGPGLLLGRQVQQMRRLSVQELFQLIQTGIPGTEMPPFRLPDR